MDPPQRSRPARRPGGHCVWAALLAGLLAGACARGERPERPPLVVLVVLDTLAAGHVSHLGYDRLTTPNLDRLAAEGVTFEAAITPATYTVAAMPSLWTGQLPDRHGVLSYEHRLPPDRETLPELLARAGYRTFGLVANPNAGPRYGNERGFEEFVEVYVGPGPAGAVQGELEGELWNLPRADQFPPLVDRVLDRTADDEHVFLYVHVLEPHDPYDPPLSFKQQFVDERMPHPYVPGERTALRLGVGEDQLPPEEDRERLIRLYDANILWADHVLGEILDGLRERGLYDSALILVTSDHGESFWGHGTWGHGYTVHESEVAVPLVLKLPADQGPRGARVPALVSLLDIVPTLGELLDLRSPAGHLDGRSLVPYLWDPGAPDWGRRFLVRSYEGVGEFALRSARLKAIARVERGDEGLAVVGVRLYDLARDPLEELDLAPERPRVAAEWGREILELLEHLDTVRPTDAQAAGELSGADRELLERLGYVGGGGGADGAGDR